MIGARPALLGAIIAILVALGQQGVVRLVDASGAQAEPRVILILLLAAFLGVLTAVVTRMLRLPGAVAPSALVLGWILVPPLFGAIPSEATQLFANSAGLADDEALALVVATLAAAVTLAVPADTRR